MHRIEVNVQTGEETTIPLTEEEIKELQEQAAKKPELTIEQQRMFRASAYQQEADPLFFKYQAGEITKEEWIAKREEIRERFPYPLNNQEGEDL